MFEDIGFTSPTFYEEPMYNSKLMAGRSSRRWSLARGPFGAKIDAPAPSRAFFSEEQLENIENLDAICLGDEEPCTPERVTWWGQYFDRVREVAPTTLVHTNSGLPWPSDDDLRDLIQRAKPDFISFDDYWVSEKRFNWNGGSITELYDFLLRYRNLAIEGLDGTGAFPISWGHYTLGFRTGIDQWETGSYVISESQQNITSFVVWAMGGKWLGNFRMEASAAKDGAEYFWLLNYEDGSPTPQYHRQKALNAVREVLSPYLVRLRSTAVAVKHGQYLTDGETVQTPEASIRPWVSAQNNANKIASLDVRNIGSANDGLPGDILVGDFELIPGLKKEEVEPYFEPGDSGHFMMLNGLTQANTDWTNYAGIGGSAAECAQSVTLTFDLGAESEGAPNKLRHLNPFTGHVSVPQLATLGGGQFSLTHVLTGGTGELFWWAA